MGKAKFSKLGRKKSVKSVSKKCAKKTSVSSKAKKPKKPKPQPETDPFCEDEYRFGKEFTTIKMGLKDMVVDDQFFENLNDVVVRASKVAILGSFNVYYEFKKAFDDNNFTKIERLAIKIKKKPECFFNGVRGRKTVNQDDCDEMAKKYFTQFDIALQPPEGMSQVIMYIAQQYRTNLMNFVQNFAIKRVIACLLIFFARRTIKRQPIDKESKKRCAVQSRISSSHAALLKSIWNCCASYNPLSGPKGILGEVNGLTVGRRMIGPSISYHSCESNDL